MLIVSRPIANLKTSRLAGNRVILLVVEDCDVLACD